MNICLTHAEVVAELGGDTALAAALSIEGILIDREGVRGWRRTNSIPGPYWRAIVRIADRNGKTHITLDTLADAAAKAGSSTLLHSTANAQQVS